MNTRVAQSECAVPELSPTSIPIRTPLVATLLFLLLLGSRLALLAADDSQRVAPLLEGMGDHHHPITTDNPMVQRFFDQGLVLAYGFNHAEAARSFREAIRLEPDCASCYWGLSYVLGPNINSMMDASDLPEAWNALQKALEYKDKASPKEQAFIAALSKRYTAEAPDDRSHLDKAYADKMRQPGYSTVQHYWITPLYALVRFGRWEEILQEPPPEPDLIYPVGVWHYVRATALIRTHRLAEAARELASLTDILADPSLASITVWDLNDAASLLAIAREVVAGELATARGDLEAGIRHLETGVALESKLTYDEPPTWHSPVRLNLGAVLLQADRPAEAERVYREDLEIYPDNGWALIGLQRSLEAQGKTPQAEEVALRYAKAWQNADLSLTASRL